MEAAEEMKQELLELRGEFQALDRQLQGLQSERPVSEAAHAEVVRRIGCGEEVSSALEARLEQLKSADAAEAVCRVLRTSNRELTSRLEATEAASAAMRE